MNILIVEDDRGVSESLRKALSGEGFVVDQAYDGADALLLARRCEYSAILLDLKIPVIDGQTVLRELRRAGLETPILVLTGEHTSEDDIQEGFDLGVDDYLLKPVGMVELKARLVARIRRRHGKPVDRLVIADLEIDLKAYRVTRGGRTIRLTAREFEILALLARHPGEVLSRATILDRVWGTAAAVEPNVVDVHIHHLRSKIDTPCRTALLRTVWGRGYALDAP